MRGELRVVAAGVIAASVSTVPAAFAVDDRPLLVLDAYPAEGARILAAAKPESDAILELARPVEEVGTFNGRRFFAGTVAGRKIVHGLVGIGLVNARETTIAVLDHFQNQVSGIVFSGVAGSAYEIGDVVIPDEWADGGAVRYPVDPEMREVAAGLVDVPLEACLGAPDTECTGERPPVRTPICFGTPAEPVRIHVGGTGFSSDPYGGRAVPCLSGAGDLEGCEPCGAPPNDDPAPGGVRFVEGSLPFLLPSEDGHFFLDLLDSFSGGGGVDTPVVVDMETTAVAAVAADRGIPFIAIRAVSDGDGDPLGLPGFPFQFFAYQQLAADNAGAVTLAFIEGWANR